jgi:response regulator of citrate/malate metabolism
MPEILLLINNNPLDQAIFAVALNEISPDTVCIVAENEADVLDILRDAEVKPTLILADRHLPGFDAVHFMERSKNLKYSLETTVILHCDAREVNEKVRACGAHALYCKEYTIDGVRNMLYFYMSTSPGQIMLN